MQETFTALLVDDMPAALSLLENDIKAHFPGIRIIGKAQSVVEAAKWLRKEQPDILFLDIMLGDGTGFDVLEIIPALKSQVIFVTASDEHAIRAFRFAAIDYLLKPYTIDELEAAVSKALRTVQPSSEQLHILRDQINSPATASKRISLSTQEKIEVVEVSRIIRCEADNNNTLFVLEPNKKIFVTQTLMNFEKLLKPYQFIRAHQSHLVNLYQIQSFIKTDGGYLNMSNGDRVPVSVRKKQEIMKFLEF